MTKYDCSDPVAFRRMLRKILCETLPVVTATSLLVNCGQSITILPSEYDSKRGDMTVQVDASEPGRPDEPFVLPEPRPEIPREFRPELPPEPQSSWDFSNIPAENQLNVCPAAPCHESGELERLEKTGRFVRMLTASDPQPLSYEQCVKLCKDQLSSVCREQSQNEIFTYYNFQATSCVEEVDPFNKRGMICDYKVMRSCAVAGRRPAGMQDSHETLTVQSEEQVVGLFFAELAHLEEAAVTAFQYLTRELEAYNAPEELLLLARRAIDEEVEHAEMMRGLAFRYGASPQPVQVEPFALRPLAEIAYENAQEGCIREAYGSLMAMWQAATSEDPVVSAVMERIAYEESAHAALSFAIDAWIRPQLSTEEQQHYAQLQAESLQMLQQELSNDPSPALVRWAGYPSKETGIRLFQQLQQNIHA